LELDSLEVAREIVDAVADKQGEEILLLDISGIAAFADYFVIATVSSDRQADAIVESVRESMKGKLGLRSPYIERDEHSDWVLVDCGDTIVHLFRAGTRAMYDLEGLWSIGRELLRMV
jgi:ribosome-associated protein